MSTTPGGTTASGMGVEDANNALRDNAPAVSDENNNPIPPEDQPPTVDTSSPEYQAELAKQRQGQRVKDLEARVDTLRSSKGPLAIRLQKAQDLYLELKKDQKGVSKKTFLRLEKAVDEIRASLEKEKDAGELKEYAQRLKVEMLGNRGARKEIMKEGVNGMKGIVGDVLRILKSSKNKGGTMVDRLLEMGGKVVEIFSRLQNVFGMIVGQTGEYEAFTVDEPEEEESKEQEGKKGEEGKESREGTPEKPSELMSLRNMPTPKIDEESGMIVFEGINGVKMDGWGNVIPNTHSIHPRLRGVQNYLRTYANALTDLNYQLTNGGDKKTQNELAVTALRLRDRFERQGKVREGVGDAGDSAIAFLGNEFGKIRRRIEARPMRTLSDLTEVPWRAWYAVKHEVGDKLLGYTSATEANKYYIELMAGLNTFNAFEVADQEVATMALSAKQQEALKPPEVDWDLKRLPEPAWIPGKDFMQIGSIGGNVVTVSADGRISIAGNKISAKEIEGQPRGKEIAEVARYFENPYVQKKLDEFALLLDPDQPSRLLSHAMVLATITQKRMANNPNAEGRISLDALCDNWGKMAYEYEEGALETAGYLGGYVVATGATLGTGLVVTAPMAIKDSYDWLWQEAGRIAYPGELNEHLINEMMADKFETFYAYVDGNIDQFPKAVYNPAKAAENKSSSPLSIGKNADPSITVEVVEPAEEKPAEKPVEEEPDDETGVVVKQAESPDEAYERKKREEAARNS